MKFNRNPKNLEIKESREERFKRIASKRVQDILDKLRLLGNCSDKSNYNYTPEQVNKIFKTIEDEVKRVKTTYSQNKPSNSKFNL